MAVYRPTWSRRRPTWIGSLPAVIPTNASVPVIAGTLLVGQTLTGTDGVWNDSPTSYTRQWYRDAQGNGVFVAVGGATASTYLLTTADAGCDFIFGVIASNAAGSSVEARSAQVGLVIGQVPSPTLGAQVAGLRIVIDDGQRQQVFTPLANSGTWSSAAVGGFASATFAVEGWITRKKVPYLAKVTVTFGEYVIFEGRVEDLTWSVSGTDVVTTIDCFGFRRLLDDNSARRIYLKRALAWTTLPVGPGGVVGNAGTSITRAPNGALALSSGNFDPTDLTKSGVGVAGAGIAIPTLQGDALLVQFNGLTIRQVLATVTISGANTGAGKLVAYYQIQNPADATAGGIDSGTITASGSLSVSASAAAARSVLRLGAQNAAVGSLTPTSADLIQWSAIRILGTSVVEDVAGSGIYGGTILNDLLTLVPGLAAGIIETGSDFAIPSLERVARTAISDMLNEVVSYYTREWAVWEGPRLDWKTIDVGVPHWIVTMGELSDSELKSSSDGIARTVYVGYTDAATGLASEASAASADVRANPYVRTGAAKDMIVSPGVPMTSNSASQLAARLAASLGGAPQVTGTVVLPATKLVQSAVSRGSLPAFLIRAGQNLLIADAPKFDPFSGGVDQETLFHIVGVDVDLSTSEVTLQLGGFGQPTDVLLARLAAVTRVLTG